VSGRLPFVGKSFDALTKLKCEATAPLLSSMPGVVRNEALDELVARSLARRPEDRHASASDMLQEWWRVAAALDRDHPLAEATDVVFEDDEPSNTLVDGSGPKLAPSDSHLESGERQSGDHSTHPNAAAPVSASQDDVSYPTRQDWATVRALIEKERELERKRKGTGS
jgi:hypothetical protein